MIKNEKMGIFLISSLALLIFFVKKLSFFLEYTPCTTFFHFFENLKKHVFTPCFSFMNEWAKKETWCKNDFLIFLKKRFFHIMKKTFHRIYHNAENFTGTEEDIFSEKCSFSCKFHDYGQNIPRLQ